MDKPPADANYGGRCGGRLTHSSYTTPGDAIRAAYDTTTERHIDKPFLLRFGVLLTAFQTRQNLDALVRHDVRHTFTSAQSRATAKLQQSSKTRKAFLAAGVRGFGHSGAVLKPVLPFQGISVVL